MDIVTLGAALNGSAEYVNSHFKGGSNIQIVDNPDGTQTINASGEVSSEDTVARAEIAAIKDGETLDSFGDVETALDDKANTATTYTKTEVDTALDSKQNTISDLSTIRSGAALGATAVQPETGKGLSTNDYTNAEKSKLAGIEAQANKTTVDDALSGSSTNPVQNKVVKSALDGKANASTTYTKTEVDTALSGKQNVIDSSHKLSADLIDDTNTTNKFATAAQLAQITTNQNNILSAYSRNQVSATTANTYEYSGLSVTCPANELIEIWIVVENGGSNPLGIIVNDSNSNAAAQGSIIAESAETISGGGTALWARELHCIPPRKRGTAKTFYIWVKWETTGTNYIQLITRPLVT